MPNPTNSELARLITNIQSETRDFRKETKQSFREVGNRMDGMNKKIQTFDTFMAVQKDRQKRSQMDWGGVAKQGIAAITTALGIVFVLTQIVLRLIDR